MSKAQELAKKYNVKKNSKEVNYDLLAEVKADPEFTAQRINEYSTLYVHTDRSTVSVNFRDARGNSYMRCDG